MRSSSGKGIRGRKVWTKNIIIVLLLSDEKMIIYSTIHSWRYFAVVVLPYVLHSTRTYYFFAVHVYVWPGCVGDGEAKTIKHEIKDVKKWSKQLKM